MNKKFSANLFLLLGVLAYSLSMLLHPLYHHTDSNPHEVSSDICVFQAAAGHDTHISVEFFCPICAGVFGAIDIPEPLTVLETSDFVKDGNSPWISYIPQSPCIPHSSRAPPINS